MSDRRMWAMLTMLDSGGKSRAFTNYEVSCFEWYSVHHKKDSSK
jgi:hypothetical protein